MFQAVEGAEDDLAQGAADLRALEPTVCDVVLLIAASGATPATAVSCTSTFQCTATSPAGSGIVDVIASTAAGSSANTSADDYTYTCPPTVVTSSSDSGAGSLRQIIADACAGSVITFGGSVTTVTLTSGELLITKNLSIDGGLGVNVVRQAAAPEFRIFDIAAGNTVVLDSLTISNGHLADEGAGIVSMGTLTLLDSVISGNTSKAGFGGGGISSYGTLILDNTTVSGNSSAAYGGGIVQYNGGSAQLTRCTVSGNSAQYGGAVLSQSLPLSTSLDVRNCTISGNNASIDGPGIYILAGSAGAVSTFSMVNSTVAANSGPGAAIFTRVIAGTASSTLENNVYAANSGANVSTQGGGVSTSLGHNLSDDASGGGGLGDVAEGVGAVPGVPVDVAAAGQDAALLEEVVVVVGDVAEVLGGGLGVGGRLDVVGALEADAADVVLADVAVDAGAVVAHAIGHAGVADRSGLVAGGGAGVAGAAGVRFAGGRGRGGSAA